MVKTVSHKVVQGGGIVRSIRNHGIRDLPHPFRAKYPDTQGNRRYPKGRFISIYYDASPFTMRAVESHIRLEECVLRQTHLKTRSKLDAINITKETKNPYLRKIIMQEQESTIQQMNHTSPQEEEETLLTNQGVEESSDTTITKITDKI